MALKKSNILHRDISAGNILLYPKLEEAVDNDDQVIGQAWVLGGMLTDWELAKCITIQYPRQPERTVRGPPFLSLLLTLISYAGNVAIHVCRVAP